MSGRQIALAALVGAVGLAIAGWGVGIFLDDTPPFARWVAPALVVTGLLLVVATILWVVVRGQEGEDTALGEPSAGGSENDVRISRAGANTIGEHAQVHVHLGGESAREPAVGQWAGRPASLGGGFVGRQDDLRAIASAFASHRAVVVSGGAGSGKSRLAAEHTHRSKADGFWTSGGANLASTLAALAPAFGIAVEGKGDDEVAGDVQRRLAGLPPETLWVVDNLADLELANALLNASGSVRLLVTTRDSRSELLPATVAYHQTEVLEHEAAIGLLRSRGQASPEDPALARIAELVGHLPLALEVLAARLGAPLQSPETVLAQLERAPTSIQMEIFERALGASIPRAEADGVFAAIVGTLQDLSDEDRQALVGLGYLADSPVPDALAAGLTGLDDDGLAGLLSRCARQSILSWADGQVKIHALTVAAVAATNPVGSLDGVLKRARSRLAAINQDDPVGLRAELAHNEAVHSGAEGRLGADERGVLSFRNSLAIGYNAAGRTEEAIGLWERTLGARERGLGQEHPDTLSTRNNLAAGYRDAARFEEAMTLDLRTLEARELVLGPEHPDTLSSRNNLAADYRVAERSDDAVRLAEQVLEESQRVLEPEYHNTLVSRTNLASIYRDAERFEEAMTLDENTMEVRERVLGPEHPDTLTGRINLAAGYRDSGRFEEAITLDERTLEVRERVLGQEHPDTLASRNNVAAGYSDAGRTEDAIRLHEQVLEVRERVLGPSMPTP